MTSMAAAIHPGSAGAWFGPLRLPRTLVDGVPERTIQDSWIPDAGMLAGTARGN